MSCGSSGLRRPPRETLWVFSFLACKAYSFAITILLMRDVTPSELEQDRPTIPTYMDSILELFPQELEEKYRLLEEEVVQQSETTIRTLLSPTPQMEAIRTRIWALVKVRTATKDAGRIQLSEIATGIAPVRYVEQVFGQKYMVAWCGCPPMDYDTRIEALLDKAYQKLQAILEFPLVTPNGQIDTKAANLVIQVAKMIDLRSKGGYLERVESKTFQVNSTVEEAKKLFRSKDTLTLEELDLKIQQLERGEVPLAIDKGTNNE